MNEVPTFNYEITFPDFEPSDAIRADVQKHLGKLERLSDRIIFCHVAVRAPHLSKRQHIYHIHIHLQIPGEDVIVTQEPDRNPAHMDVYVAIRDAFAALHRQLKKRIDYMRDRPGTKLSYQRGVVKSFDPQQGYGFVEARDGREIYFHQNSLMRGEPSDIQAGSRVKFMDEPGEKGRHVTSMSVL